MSPNGHEMSVLLKGKHADTTSVKQPARICWQICTSGCLTDEFRNKQNKKRSIQYTLVESNRLIVFLKGRTCTSDIFSHALAQFGPFIT